LGSEENVFGGHAKQSWSLESEPRTGTYEPAGHGVQAVQLAAFVVVEKVPVAQPEHTWSVVEVAAVETNVPAPQTVTATHAVAGF
jgi:hypothetical protein